MSYCLQCGTKAKLKIPKGDTRERIVCDDCGYIHYQNPNIVCGALVAHQGKILMCKRAIEPQYGKWTLPAGFMEIGETMMEGAKRETYEEALAVATNMKLYCLFDIPALGQVHAMYLANLETGLDINLETALNNDSKLENLNGQLYGVGEESLETELIALDDIDWDNISFESVRRTLKYFIADSEQFLDDAGSTLSNFNDFPLYEERIEKSPNWGTN